MRSKVIYIIIEFKFLCNLNFEIKKKQPYTIGNDVQYQHVLEVNASTNLCAANVNVVVSISHLLLLAQRHVLSRAFTSDIRRLLRIKIICYKLCRLFSPVMQLLYHVRVDRICPLLNYYNSNL